MRVNVYRNLRYRPQLRYPAWTIATGDSRAKVLEVVDAAVLTDAVLIVRQTDQRRIVSTFERTGKRKKTVHAFVGPKDLFSFAGRVSRLGYNPFVSGEFVRSDCGIAPIAGELTGRGGTIWTTTKRIPLVLVTPDGVYAKLGRCPAKAGGALAGWAPATELDNWNGDLE